MPSDQVQLLCMFSRAQVERALASAGGVDPGPPRSQTIDIVFDGPPGHQAGRFVEVENQQGASIRVGEWVHRPDGYWVLRLEAMV